MILRRSGIWKILLIVKDNFLIVLKKYWWILLISVIAITVAVFWWRSHQYATIHPQRRDVTEAVYSLGKVKAYQHFEVILGVMSQVQNLYVEEGDTVSKGAPLIRFTQGADFRAPFSGTVTLVRVRPSEVAPPNTVLLRLDDLTDCYIELSLEQQTALRIRRGQPVKISFEDLRGEVLSGTVDAIFPREDEFLAHVRVKGLKPGILPGMTADVSIEVGQTKNALMIPLSAVSHNMVTVKNGRKWERRQVKLGLISANWAEVLDQSLDEHDELRVPKGN